MKVELIGRKKAIVKGCKEVESVVAGRKGFKSILKMVEEWGGFKSILKMVQEWGLEGGGKKVCNHEKIMQNELVVA